jgi:glutaredoxin-like protein
MALTMTDKEALGRALAHMHDDVQLLAFIDGAGSTDSCPLCADMVALAKTVADSSDRISLTVRDLHAEPAAAATYGVDHTPALAFVGPDGDDPGIRFFGVPWGYELAALIQVMALLSAGDPALRPETREALTGLAGDVVIKVFVTPNCPFCPRAALTAMQMALASPRVRAEVVEVTEFPELAHAYGVMGVPKIVVNDEVEVEGAVPEDTFLQAVLGAVGTSVTAASQHGGGQ